MLKQIGKTRRTPPDVVALMLDCHGKIRHFVALARAAGEASAEPAEVADACAQARRYFAEALPLHIADEEESLLPRLRGRDAGLDRALAAMHDEHEAHGPHVTALLEALTRVHDAPTDAALRGQLASSAAALARSFDAHLEAEEQHVFPALRSLLSEPEQHAILGELRARRQP